MEQLITILSQDSCPILNLFIDWNAIYNDNYKEGYIEDNMDNLHKPDD